MITKELLATFRTDMEKAMKDVYEKHGLVGSGAKISYMDHSFKMTVEVGEKDKVGNSNPIFVTAMQKYGWNYNLKVEDIGKEFKVGNNSYILKGLTKLGRDLVGQLKNSDKMFKFKKDQVIFV